MTKHLFVIDPVDKLNLRLDTSMQLAAAFESMRDDVWFCEISGFEWNSKHRSASAHCYRVALNQPPKSAPQPREIHKLSLSEFDLIHMRKDPPFDIAYVTATWFLDACGPKTKVLNRPESVRSINEKLGTLRFPDEILPTIVSSSANDLVRFSEEVCKGDMIVKPLDMFGGHGVVRLTTAELGGTAGLSSELQNLTESGAKHRIAQPFQSKVAEGEVRCFCFGEEPIAWTLKRPAKGSFMANTRLGATLEPYKPSDSEVQRVRRVGAKLAMEGALMIGFDMIGGLITEMNITSPRLLSIPERMQEDHQKLAHSIKKWLG
jgi:glutathione synthase